MGQVAQHRSSLMVVPTANRYACLAEKPDDSEQPFNPSRYATNNAWHCNNTLPQEAVHKLENTKKYFKIFQVGLSGD